MSSYANVDYDDVKDIPHKIWINPVTYMTELIFDGPPNAGYGADLHVSHDLASGAINATVCFPFSRDRERRTLLVDWFVEHGLMFNVVT